MTSAQAADTTITPTATIQTDSSPAISDMPEAPSGGPVDHNLGANISGIAERLKVAVRAGNHLDHREIEAHDVEVRFRDSDGQLYRVDLNHPEMLRRILRSDVAEPLANSAA